MTTPTTTSNDTSHTFIRQVRQRAGLSLRRVASECGITAPYLYDLEMGHRALKPARRKMILEVIRRQRAAGGTDSNSNSSPRPNPRPERPTKP